MPRLCVLGLSLAAVSLTASWCAAQDRVVTKDGVVHTGTVSRVEADGIFLKLAAGELKLFKADIARIEIDEPEAYGLAVAALKAKKFSEAAAGLRALVDRYARLSVPWVQEAMLRLGDAYVGLKDFAKAKKTFDDFKTFYPQSPLAAGIDVKFAHVLAEQGDCAKAIDTLNGLIGPLLKAQYLSDEQQAAAAEALLLRGDCQRKAQQRQDALDSYLMVVTLFNVDPERTAEAKYKAAQVFEEAGNWKRAKGSYEELLRDAPSMAFAADAQQRLTALRTAHPE